ncbi:dispanin subfamily A member 2b-like [Stegastes partitus]|uniref:Dispanin subfamily A member 2b-like n=1 Tax=Stegastes partitus TaxID=144197 RepID=A0A3B5B5K7_9TELE|nr:PREDICTED: dispanin subfamily A member 2b-like [Stegastes partitus]
MNPEGYPSDSVPLQGRPYDGFSGQPAGPSMVQYTTVNVTEEPPKDHIIWSIFNFAYMNLCCLGLVALIHSIKARDRKVVGDLEGAREYGSIASCFNMAATVFTCLIILFLFFFVLFAVRF